MYALCPPHRVTGVTEAFVQIYTAGGVRGLWKGCMPNVYRFAKLWQLNEFMFSLVEPFVQFSIVPSGN